MQVREEAQEGAQARRFLGLRHTRTIKMAEDVLAVRITPDGRLIALALLDSTVQVGVLPAPVTPQPQSHLSSPHYCSCLRRLGRCPALVGQTQ